MGLGELFIELHMVSKQIPLKHKFFRYIFIEQLINLKMVYLF